jgi:hypothetical protein
MAGSIFASQATYEKALNDTFSASDEEFDVLFKTMWSANIEATIDGHSWTYEGFYNHIKKLRSVMENAEVKVLTFLRDGNKFADRHTGDATMKDGQKSHVDAYCFGEIGADGRITKFEEAIILKGAHPLKDEPGHNHRHIEE